MPRKEQLDAYARQMRRAPTVSEARLWEAIRVRRLGVGFRRQVVIEGFIVDFLAPSIGLVVEVDGGYHSERVRADARRERALVRAGYRVLRLPAELVMRDLAGAVESIHCALERK